MAHDAWGVLEAFGSVYLHPRLLLVPMARGLNTQRGGPPALPSPTHPFPSIKTHCQSPQGRQHALTHARRLAVRRFYDAVLELERLLEAQPYERAAIKDLEADIFEDFFADGCAMPINIPDAMRCVRACVGACGGVRM